jgi:hypothetical protein
LREIVPSIFLKILFNFLLLFSLNITLLTVKIIKWSSDIQKWSKLSKDTAQLYISQSESRLSATIESANTITNATDKAFGLITTLLSISIGYLCTGADCYLKGVSFFILINGIVAILLLLKNMNKYNLCTLGEEPQIIFNSQFVDNDFTPEEQYINLAFQIIESTQSKIEHNHLINAIRQSRLQKTRICLLFIPTSFILANLWCHYWKCWG